MPALKNIGSRPLFLMVLLIWPKCFNFELNKITRSLCMLAVVSGETPAAGTQEGRHGRRSAEGWVERAGGGGEIYCCCL